MNVSDFIQWLKRLLGLDKKPPAPRPMPKRPQVYLPPPPPRPERKLPRSFTNRPGVKRAQVNLGESGYREDARIEEQPRRRRQ